MSTHLRYLADFEIDDTYERMCGLGPEPFDLLHLEQLEREDREADHFPPRTAGIWMTTAPTFTPDRPPARASRTSHACGLGRAGANPGA